MLGLDRRRAKLAGFVRAKNNARRADSVYRSNMVSLRQGCGGQLPFAFAFYLWPLRPAVFRWVDQELEEVDVAASASPKDFM